MNYEISKVREMLSNFPKKNLGFYPSPLHKLENLSAELGINLYLKREDLTGRNLFGGNKIRKLEYLLGDAIQNGCDTVLTYGATQSNHAMQTASVSRQCGLKPVLVLADLIDTDFDEVKSNLLLDYVLGAEVQIIPYDNKPMSEVREQFKAQGKNQLEKIESKGGKCYEVPTGGSSVVGVLGFVSGFLEMYEQMQVYEERIDYIMHASGTGGTIAGLTAGRKLVGDEDIKIIGFSVSEKNESHEQELADLANDAINLIGANVEVEAKDFTIDRNYIGPGYEVPSILGNQAVKKLASSEGVFMDPVYSGKGFAGLLDYIEKKRIPKGSTVVFVHTGGATALFSEKDIVGDISNSNKY